MSQSSQETGRAGTIGTMSVTQEKRQMDHYNQDPKNWPSWKKSSTSFVLGLMTLALTFTSTAYVSRNSLEAYTLI
jgi:hypothetical protein